MPDNRSFIHSQECLVCKNRGMKIIYSGILRKCLQCGFVTANLDLNPAEIEELYGDAYFKGDEYLDYERNKVILQKNFRKKVKAMERIAPRKKITSILEIGCAYGFFGEVVRSMIPGSSYLGFDISQEAIRYAAERLNLNVSGSGYLEYNANNKFTDICMWDVIEHIQYPDCFLEKIHTDLEPCGRLWITTGDMDAMVPRIMKSKWRMIHPPTHLHYFSARTLNELLRRKGFQVCHISYPAVARGLQQIFYSLFMLGKHPGRVIRKIHSAIPPGMSFYLNTFDIMFVMAVKKG